MPDTTNYAWTKPTVGGSIGTWGTENNACWDEADASVKAVEDAALKLAGGTMTGALHALTATTPATALGNITGANDTIDLALGQLFHGTVTGAPTFTFTNPPASGKAFGFVLELTNGGAFAVTWPASVTWPSSTAPTLTAAGTDILVFITRDGGVTWRGAMSQQDVG